MIEKLCELLVLLVVFSGAFGQERGVIFDERSLGNLVTYTKCRIDSDCLNVSNNSFCFGNDAEELGFCKCLESFELVSRNKTSFSCLGPAGYGEPCERNVQCQLRLTENAECASGLCQCKAGAHQWTDGKCYVSVLLGEVCLSDRSCWLSDGSFGNCVYGRCTCKFDKQVPTVDKIGCIDGRELGELCENDNQCSVVPNAVCRVSCKCGAEFVLSRDRTRCLRAATEFSDLCEENEQCSAFLHGSSCRNGHCTCQNGHHGVGTRCLRSVSLSNACTESAECVTDRKYSGLIDCIDGICQCAHGVVNETIGCSGFCILRCNFVLVVVSGFLIILKLF